MTKFMMVRRLPFSPRFPYSTLFRSTRSKFCLADNSQGFLIRTAANTSDNNRVFNFPTFVHDKLNVNPPFNTRSEEHTSELQSRGHLVCRLLPEKKKAQHKRTATMHR